MLYDRLGPENKVLKKSFHTLFCLGKTQETSEDECWSVGCEACFPLPVAAPCSCPVERLAVFCESLFPTDRYIISRDIIRDISARKPGTAIALWKIYKEC